MDKVLVGILAATGAVAAAALYTGPGPAKPAGTGLGCCQLCTCNDGVVPCQVPGSTCPEGQGCAMCNGPGGAVVPCLTPL